MMSSGESKWLLYYLFSRPSALYAHIEGRLVILFSSLWSQGAVLPLSPSIYTTVTACGVGTNGYLTSLSCELSLL